MNSHWRLEFKLIHFATLFNHLDAGMIFIFLEAFLLGQLSQLFVIGLTGLRRFLGSLLYLQNND